MSQHPANLPRSATGDPAGKENRRVGKDLEQPSLAIGNTIKRGVWRLRKESGTSRRGTPKEYCEGNRLPDEPVQQAANASPGTTPGCTCGQGNQAQCNT